MTKKELESLMDRMTTVEAVRFVQSLVGKKLRHLCCEAEILDFDFPPLALHAMGCSRIIKGNELLVTTLDYQSWDQSESTHNDEWFNVKAFHSEIVGGTVLSVHLSPWHDLRIELDNGVVIECLIANAQPHYADEQAQWVLFEPTKSRDGAGAFLTVYNKSIAFRKNEGTNAGRLQASSLDFPKEKGDLENEYRT